METKRTVVITGGTKGIGASISRSFYEKGYYVVIGARSDSGLAAELGEHALFHATDVRKPQELHALVQHAVKWAGRLDVMINNAGVSWWKPIEDVDEEFWNSIVETNLRGTFFGCKAAAAHLKPGGSIVNISSLAGKRGSANNSVYCASKFGVNGITQALSKELGSAGIRVNAVCPVYVQTEGLVRALEEKDSPVQETDVESYLKDFTAANAALLRLPTGEEIARVCLFLASSGASAITGQCINVDCGVLPQ